MPFLILGQSGDGRIDLFAFDGKPKITFVTQGATYNAQTEFGKIGNLNGSYAYVTDTYGAAFGDPAGAWVKIDPTNGLRLGFNTTTTVQIDASGNATFENGIDMGASGSLTAGGVVLDASGVLISPISASGGGAYANANAVRWTTDLTARTAIWRSDDTGASPVKTWQFDNIFDNGTIVGYTKRLTKTNNFGSYGYVVEFQRTQASAG